MRKNIFGMVLVCLLALPLFIGAQTVTKKGSPAMNAAENVTAKQMSEYLHYIASDVMEGRNTPSRGLDTVAQFIGLNLTRWGFKPAGDDGTFYQKIALLSETADPQNSTLKVGANTLKYGEDYYRLTGSTLAAVSAPLVYGGDGWLVKSKNIDAFQGVDVSGKIVVLYSDGVPGRFGLTSMPSGVARTDLTPTGRGTDWADPATYAKAKGAVGIIIVASAAAQQGWATNSAPGAARPFVEKFRTAETPVPTVVVSQKVGDMIFADASRTPYKAKDGTYALNSSQAVSFNLALKQDRVYTQNVVAIWEGSDPVLKNEMVAIGAHYDHVGNSPLTGCRPVNGDSLCNGADDDGSGTTGVLAIAEALAKSKVRPKRSILFVWHCGEEKGLWGSQYFNKYPTVDIKKVIAQLNIDMIGRSKKPGYMAPCDTNPAPGRRPCNETLSGENQIYVIGSQMMSSKLGQIVADTNKNYLKIDYDLRYDDPKDPNRFFFRSDHFNYALNGIPITFWFDGEHEDYHQPGDEPDKIDYNKMEKVSRTIMLTLWEVANLKERPAIDKQLPPELNQR